MAVIWGLEDHVIMDANWHKIEVLMTSIIDDTFVYDHNYKISSDNVLR